MEIISKYSGTWISCCESLGMGPIGLNLSRNEAIRIEFYEKLNSKLNMTGDVEDRLVNWWSRELGPIDQLSRLLSELSLPPQKIIFWSRDNWNDRLYVWWALYLLHQWADENGDFFCDSKLFVGEFDLGDEPDCSKGLIELSKRDQMMGVELWLLFARGEPDRLFELKRNHMHDSFDLGLDDFLTTYVSLFPRMEKHGVFLSEFDSLLLNLIGENPWCRLVDLFEHLMSEIDCLGSMIVVYRFIQWSEHHQATDPAVIRKKVKSNGSIWTQHAYSLTETGKEILANGIATLSDAPSFPCGGISIYSEKDSWVYKINRGFRRL